ncbi:MAG: MFS transporter [Paramuribaculum sp.]|nr:MFS transporter [Paramuribaculum sp.]
MQVKTGKGAIPVMVVIAIWSLSLGINLPGLAVTPIEGNLHKIFSSVSDFQVQLLTVLPNLVIIPFVLLSGRLSMTSHKIPVIAAGVIIYVLSGILYLFSKSLDGLIWISCLLGAGCGLMLPFTTGLVADVFTGKYKLRQMGIVSAIGNIALVVATFIVGFLANVNWHLPFLVYVLPIISLILLPWFRKIPKDDMNLDENGNPVSTPQPAAATDSAAADSAPKTDSTAASAPAPATETLVVPKDDDADFSTAGQKIVGGFYLGRTIWTLLAYFFFVFATSVPAYYLPNIHGIDAEKASIITSCIYFAMFIIGISLNSVLKLFKSVSFIVSGGLLLGGFIIFALTNSEISFIIAASLVGFGQGMAQPIFFDKATEICVNNSHATLSMAYLQVANYVAIAIVPVIVGFFAWIFKIDKTDATTHFPFVLNMIFMAIVYVFIIIRYKHFTFGIHKAYYE